MKKRGFTLVELLAVIAILAILIIIALPNVMKLFNDAKESSFKNELKEIYKTAQQQWISDSMINTEVHAYSRGASTACTVQKELDLVGRSQIKYGIVVDKAGDIVNFVATDDTYAYQFNGQSRTNVLKIEDIGSVAASAVDTQNAVVRLSDYDKTSASFACDSSNVGEGHSGNYNYSLAFVPGSGTTGGSGTGGSTTPTSTAEFNWTSTSTSTTYYLLGGKKFKSTGTANLLLLDSSLGYKNWSDANTAANGYMPTYNSRLMTKAEAELMNSNERKFSNTWWLSSAASGSFHYNVYGVDGYINCLTDSNTFAVRPVVSVPSGAVITGGLGTSEEPYEITIP